MASLTETTDARKPAKAFYCTYTPLGLSGVLTRPADRVLFLEPESGAVITLSDVEVYRNVTINGPVDMVMEQYLEDMARGGYAKIATSRKMEVA